MAYGCVWLISAINKMHVRIDQLFSRLFVCLVDDTIGHDNLKILSANGIKPLQFYWNKTYFTDLCKVICENMCYAL